MRLSASIAVLTMCALFAFGGIAYGQTPTLDAYGGEAGLLQGVDRGEGGGPSAGGPGAPAEEGDEGGNLPFTGFELGLTALIGVVLLGSGFAARRLVVSGPPTA
jgi:hypothetical protein